MDRLVIYNIDDKYIEYLREFDNKVEVNKKSEGYKRPYVGIVLNVNKKLYFAPMSSPKYKFNNQKMKLHQDIVIIEATKNSAINLNNMIPIKEIDLLNKVDYIIKESDDKDLREYKSLIQDQTAWCNIEKNKKLIQSKAEKLYNLYTKLEDKNNLKMRCCNFKLLEEKCELYNSIKK